MPSPSLPAPSAAPPLGRARRAAALVVGLAALVGPACRGEESAGDLADAAPIGSASTAPAIPNGSARPASPSASAFAPPALRVPGEARFIAVGDTGKGNAGAASVAAAMAAKCARDGCDFVLLLGDNVYESGVSSPDDPLMIERFEALYADVEAPFHPVLGNHDYGNNGAGTDFAKGENEVLYSARSKKWRMPAAHYALSVGPLGLFALDTNLALFGRADEQRSTMKAAIAQGSAPWKVAYGHHPIVSNGPHGNVGAYDGQLPPAIGSGALLRPFFDDVVCGKVDVYLAGHDHTLQWPEPTCGGTELIVSGAGAVVSSLPGQNATRFQALDLGFAYGVATATTLTFEIVPVGGATPFRRTLTKPPRPSGSAPAPSASTPGQP